MLIQTIKKIYIYIYNYLIYSVGFTLDGCNEHEQDDLVKQSFSKTGDVEGR